MYGFGGVGQLEVRFGDLDGCYHSGTTKQSTEQGKIELLSHGPWKAEMSNLRGNGREFEKK